MSLRTIFGLWIIDRKNPDNTIRPRFFLHKNKRDSDLTIKIDHFVYLRKNRVGKISPTGNPAMSTSFILADHIELVAPYLSCRDICRLAQTCKAVKKATETVEEDIFGKHIFVKIIERAEIIDDAVPCERLTSTGEKDITTLPLSFGTSSKAKLRAIEQHRQLWKSHDAAIWVLYKPQYHGMPGIKMPKIFTHDILYVNQTYTDNMLKTYASWKVVGTY